MRIGGARVIKEVVRPTATSVDNREAHNCCQRESEDRATGLISEPSFCSSPEVKRSPAVAKGRKVETKSSGKTDNYSIIRTAHYRTKILLLDCRSASLCSDAMVQVASHSVRR